MLDQGHENKGLRWIADAYPLGAEEQHVVPLTRSAALELLIRDAEDHISDLDFPPDTIARAGAVAGWAYALEEFHCRTGAHLAALSQRGRAWTIHRNAKGFSHIDYALQGEPVTSFEPGLPHLTHGTSAEAALGFVHSGNEAGDVAFLRFLEDELGLWLPWEETEAELPAAAFT
ncbi:hypothetical protein [Streptomyces sp. NPDC051001]|uniref:hypothetical protein n=1 Tax=Streptomyces sp. NPDC051001 TaxID=3155795 RepID=UPI00341E38AF